MCAVPLLLEGRMFPERWKAQLEQCSVLGLMPQHWENIDWLIFSTLRCKSCAVKTSEHNHSHRITEWVGREGQLVPPPLLWAEICPIELGCSRTHLTWLITECIRLEVTLKGHLVQPQSRQSLWKHCRMFSSPPKPSLL